MKLEFSSIIDLHKNKPALVVAHGSSLDSISVSSFKDKGCVLFGCNEWMYFYDVYPDFWVIANTVINMRRWQQVINRYYDKLILCYSNSVDTTDEQWVENNITTNYLPYDQRHFGKCITIQEKLKEYTKYDKLYGSGDTVAVHQLAFAVLAGCNPIHFIGIDLDYKSYAKNKVNMKIFDKMGISNYYDRIINDLNVINESAKNIGVNIYNLNKNSQFDIFERC